MHEAFEFEVHRGGCFSAVARRVRMKQIFGAAAEAGDVPRKRGFGDGFRDAVGEFFC